MDIRHYCITTNNIEKALKFYCNILGMKIYKEEILEGEFVEKVLNIPSVKVTYIKLDFEDPSTSEFPPRFELHYYHNPKVHHKISQNHIAITVENIRDIYNRLSSLEIDFLSEPQQSPYNNSIICFCRDPEGNLIEFVEDLNE